MKAASRVRLSVPLSIVLLAAATVVALSPRPADAGANSTFTVDSLRDDVDANPGDGTCSTGGGNPDCTLRAAVQEANANADSSVINLPEGVIELTLFGANEDAAATGDLDVTAPLSIVGLSQSGSVIDARKLGFEPANATQDEPPDRIFHVLGGTTLSLSDLTARRGFAGPGPGASPGCGGTYNGGPLVCDGGGIYLEGTGAVLNLTDARLKSNRAEQRGGAIFVNGDDSTVNIETSTLDANSGQTGGGAIFFAGANGTIDIFDSLVGGDRALSRRMQLGNRTDDDGGAINLAGDSPTLSLDLVRFRNNSAAIHGGAIYVADTALPATITADETVFSENEAESQGGAIWLSTSADPTLTMTNSEITANHAQSNGGGIYVGTTSTAELSLTDTRVTRNKADSSGGGIYFSSVGGTLDLLDTTFANNVGSSGGGLYNDSGTATVERSTFNLNHTDSSGGAINNNAVLDLTNSTLSENQADNPTQSGAGLFNSANGDSDLLNVTINKNWGEVGGLDPVFQGLGIFNAGPETAVTAENTIVANSRNGLNCADADDTDDVLESLGGNIEDSDTCDFDHASDQPNTEPNLEPLRDNGGLTKTHLPNDGSPAIDGGTANCPPEDQRTITRPQDGDGDETATCDSGSVERVVGEDDTPTPPTGFDFYVDTDQDSVTCDTNECSLRGAIIAANDDPGPNSIFVPEDTYELMIKGTYEDASATGDLDVTDDLTITGAGRDGTIIDAKTLRDEDDTEDSDRVFHIPGDLEDGVSLTLSDLTVQGGRAEVAGGGNGTCADDCNGGGVYVQNNGSTLNLMDVLLFDNRTHRSGGGVHLGGNGGTLLIEDSQLAGNNAQSDDTEEQTVGGGAIFVRGNGSTVTITGSTIGGDSPSAEFGRRQAESNIASDAGGGGGLYIRGNGVEVTINGGTEFVENIADTAGGGAIYIHGDDPQVKANNASFVGNDSSDWAGGAVYVAPGAERSLTFRNTLFRRNQSNNDGPGGVFFVDEETNTKLTIDNSRFDRNKSDASGAGIFWDDDSGAGTGLTVTDTWFREHRTSTQGDDERGTSGGTALVLADGSATLNRVEISDGESEANGGALTNFGDLTLINTTVSGNMTHGEDTDADANSTRDGGAVHNVGEMTIRSSTFSNNESIFDTQSSSSGLREFADADHLYNGGTMRVKNTIVANGSFSEDANENGSNCFEASDINSQGFNLDDQNDCDFNSGGDNRNQNPRLGPLEQNGGPTRTHRLKNNSPAIDDGTNTNCPGVDQRGRNRPEDGDGNGSGICDKGAFERQGDEPPTCPGFANLDDFNHVVGTNGDDVLEGTGKRDVICGKKGKDVIRGKSGDDILLGEEGADKIFGGNGDDRIRANLSGDDVDAGDGNDTVSLGNGGDTASLGPGKDLGKGHGGNDVVSGDGGKDRITGEGGDDTVRGNGGDDNLRGGNGSDRLNGGPDRDKCHAGAQQGDTETNCES